MYNLDHDHSMLAALLFIQCAICGNNYRNTIQLATHLILRHDVCSHCFSDGVKMVAFPPLNDQTSDHVVH